MKVTITANRNLDPDDHSTIFNKMAELVTNENIDTIYFGGAMGGDNVALEAALSIATLNKPKLIVVVPNTMEDQPRITHEIIKRADEIIELKNPITQENNWKAYHTRNEYMVDHSDMVIGFWDNSKGGTKSTLNYAESKNKKIDIVYIVGET